jgi:hypothetical protein
VADLLCVPERGRTLDRDDTAAVTQDDVTSDHAPARRLTERPRSRADGLVDIVRRLDTAILVEQHDEWLTRNKRYLSQA